MRHRAAFVLIVGTLILSGCSEARSDIENLDTEILQDEANALSELADATVKEQVGQIPAMTIAPANSDIDSSSKVDK